MRPKIDPRRLDVLRDACRRERGALDAAVAEMNSDIERHTRLKRELADAVRQAEMSRRGRGALNGRQRAIDDLAQKIDATAQTIEIARERSRAANRLRTRCVDFVEGRA